jgi:DNA invertase Pin-like site-specific DNA recombinase
MSLFGYARTSIRHHLLDQQIERLAEAGVDADHIFADHLAKQKTDERSGLRALQDRTRPGDVIAVTSLDRLGRDLSELIRLIEQFNDRGVAVRCLDSDISTENGTGAKMLAILKAVAQAERQSIAERTGEGRLKAKEKGVKFGRKPSVDRDHIQQLRGQGVSASDIARQMRIGRSTVYNVLRSLTQDDSALPGGANGEERALAQPSRHPHPDQGDQPCSGKATTS